MLIIASLWFLMALVDGPVHVRVHNFAFGVSYLAAYFVPVWLKTSHVALQNLILRRCRALLMLATAALERNDKEFAEAVLTRIRRLETWWTIGNAYSLRVSLALWAVIWGFAICILIRFSAGVYVQYGWSQKLMTAQEMGAQMGIELMLSATAVLYALFGYFDNWKNPYAIENSGDRLWSMLHGPHGLQPAADGPDYGAMDGMSLFELFGISKLYTLKDLKLARRRLVQELHPDLLQQASPAERYTREEAIKRVNAAYDVLRRAAL